MRRKSHIIEHEKKKKNVQTICGSSGDVVPTYRLCKSFSTAILSVGVTRWLVLALEGPRPGLVLFGPIQWSSLEML